MELYLIMKLDTFWLEPRVIEEGSAEKAARN
jgi:hypothetical protein